MVIRKDWPPDVGEEAKKILLPIDGSVFSKATMRWSARFLDSSKSLIYLLSVAPGGAKGSAQESPEEMINAARAWFENHGFRVAGSEVSVDRKIAATICKYAKDAGVNHIIMGNHDKSLARRVLGSISRSVMNRAGQPVVVVKNPHASLPEDGRVDERFWRPWPSREQVTSILIPVENESTAETLIPLMEGLQNKEAAVVHILHAVVCDTANAGSVNFRLDEALKIVQKNKDDLEKAGYWVARTEYRIGNAIDVICRYADEKAIDQINLLARKRNNLAQLFPGRVSEGLLMQKKYPVLVFSRGEDQ